MRRTTTHLLPVLLILSLAGCAQQADAPTTAGPAIPDDTHSHAQPNEAKVTHVSLDLIPDFTAKRLSGTAKLAIERAAGADSIVLDIRDLAIKRVMTVSGDTLGFKIGAAREFVGQPLTIALPPSGDTIAIEYETAPDAAAVQWLSAQQTAGRKLPFLFTQGQAILTRTWLPTQDSPGIRQTYDAVIHAPTGMTAVMSAENVSTPGEKDAQGRAILRFRLDQKIPPYLIALAVGDIAFRKVGEQTGVYAEPSMVDRAAHEFAEVDQMIAAAEKLYGPYRWGRYDILVLPPSFPFGGMENPRLTFATPTVLAGDRSLVALIAHELAHSWSGNLVTNANWNDFWLNEGFTTYLEGRIMEELRGKEYADMLRTLGRQDMMSALADAGGPSGNDTRLHLDLTGRDPDAGSTNIAYEKGAAFLETVESVVGRQRLDAFLRDYFDHFAFQPMTSDIMVAYMREKLLQPGEEEKINVRAWVYEPGVPSNLPPLTSSAFAAVDSHVRTFKDGAAVSTITTDKWSTHEWLHFLRALPDSMPAARMAELDRAFKLSSSGNSEVLFEWLRIAIRNDYTPAMPALEKFLTTQGRRKFVAPLYADLAQTPQGKTRAIEIYRRARPSYHSVATNTIDKTLDWR